MVSSLVALAPDFELPCPKCMPAPPTPGRRGLNTEPSVETSEVVEPDVDASQ